KKVEKGDMKEEKKEEQKDEKKDEKKDENKDEAAAAAPARITVHLPADARLTVDGEPTTSTSAVREFVSPALPAGQAFRYTLQAEFTRNGKAVVVKKDVIVKAGLRTEVRFGADLTSVAAR